MHLSKKAPIRGKDENGGPLVVGTNLGLTFGLAEPIISENTLGAELVVKRGF